jgi:hypothetical protein
MRRSPILTLACGLVLAAGLLTVSSLAVAGRVPTAAGAAPSTSPPPATPPPLAKTGAEPSAAASSPPPLAKVNAVWAGEVDGGGASIAISVKDGVAVAYLCDGKKAEIWLSGTARDGRLALRSKDGASLTGTFGGGKATGEITGSGRKWTFTAAAVKEPSGLYRSTANVRNAQVVCGWIRLADGRTVGICDNQGNPEPAPPLDTARVNPIDPESPDLK